MAGDEGLGLVVHVRPAGQHDEAAPVDGLGPDGLECKSRHAPGRPAGAELGLRAPVRAKSHIDFLGGWGIYEAKDWPACLDQGDVDGELVAFVDEFAGAVEGIDQQELVAGDGNAPRRSLFLRHDWHTRQDLGEGLQDDGFGIAVGGRDRRPVVLVLRRHAIAVMAHDGRAGGLRDRDESASEPFEIPMWEILTRHGRLPAWASFGDNRDHTPGWRGWRALR